ncbi:MAG: ATP-binding cassette domain-containing protein [Candidatus Aminicenantes bacterium]|nr:MAG: ATP-binding cassette domain-containing protein [Candidatus Aminicenantes bacterium]
MTAQRSAEEILPDDILLDVKNLRKSFPVRKGVFARVRGLVEAVSNISFKVRQGQTLALIGESGSGKTTVARILLRLEEPDGGEVYFQGRNILDIKGRALLDLRRDIQMIFQDPFSSLNPYMTVGQIIGESLRVHKIHSRKEVKNCVQEILEKVGLTQDLYSRYPHEFSGGQRQRIGIGRALTLNPQLIVCDEPVSALDVSVRAQILNLLQDLQETLGLTYIFVGHDLSVIRHVSHEVAVMYMGKIVEMAFASVFFFGPLHPYSEALQSAAPIPDPEARKRRTLLSGDVPNLFSLPPGCRFHTRCPLTKDICSQEEPRLKESSPGHSVACHFRG